MTVREALRDAIAEEMRRYPDVFLMGEEVAEYQGAYKVSQNLLQEFGLETEPWTFLIGKDGKVADRIEGAYGVAELEQAMKKIVPG